MGLTGHSSDGDTAQISQEAQKKSQGFMAGLWSHVTQAASSLASDAKQAASAVVNDAKQVGAALTSDAEQAASALRSDLHQAEAAAKADLTKVTGAATTVVNDAGALLQKAGHDAHAVQQAIANNPVGQFLNGLSYSGVENSTAGLAPLSQPDNPSVAYKAGRVAGDVISTVQGIAETAGGLAVATGGAVGGVATSWSGVGAVAGAGVAVEGVALTLHGLTVVGMSAHNLLNDTHQLASSNGSGDAGEASPSGTKGTGDGISWTTNNEGLPVGGKITGYSDHGAEQVLGRDGGRGVSNEAIQDTVTNPQKVVEQPPTSPEYGPTSKYVGRNAVVVLNQDGRVVTAYAKGSQGLRSVK